MEKTLLDYTTFDTFDPTNGFEHVYPGYLAIIDKLKDLSFSANENHDVLSLAQLQAANPGIGFGLVVDADYDFVIIQVSIGQYIHIEYNDGNYIYKPAVRLGRHWIK